MVFGKGTKVELDWSVLERIAEYYEFPSAVFFFKDTDAFPEKTRNAAALKKMKELQGKLYGLFVEYEVIE